VPLLPSGGWKRGCKKVITANHPWHPSFILLHLLVRYCVKQEMSTFWMATLQGVLSDLNLTFCTLHVGCKMLSYLHPKF
jgi:cell shape-determining protein MreD